MILKGKANGGARLSAGGPRLQSLSEGPRRVVRRSVRFREAMRRERALWAVGRERGLHEPFSKPIEVTGTTALANWWPPAFALEYWERVAQWLSCLQPELTYPPKNLQTRQTHGLLSSARAFSRCSAMLILVGACVGTIAKTRVGLSERLDNRREKAAILLALAQDAGLPISRASTG